MIDDLFDNFFEACKDTPENIVTDILDDVIANVIKDPQENREKVVAKKRKSDAFSRSGYVKKRRKMRAKSPKSPNPPKSPKSPNSPNLSKSPNPPKSPKSPNSQNSMKSQDQSEESEVNF